MRFHRLDEWLRWQEQLHPKAIDLGLERPRLVLERMGLQRPAYQVITVGGTNGKGSTVSMLESILLAAEYRVGSYTSPHLLRYNERIHVDGVEVSDDALCEAFDRVDQARGEVTLSYFEFGTLAAFDLFSRAGIDVAILEVGLGGRLDAVNLLDPDLALIATVDVDHVDWLGPDRESIAIEKAGIFRAGRPAVCSDPRTPVAFEVAAGKGVQLYRQGREFGYDEAPSHWDWHGPAGSMRGLPRPALRGLHQLQNAAGVLMALSLLAGHLPVNPAQIAEGLRRASLPARFQVVEGPVTVVYDVAHNREAAEELAGNLRTLPRRGALLAVWSMLGDKAVEEVAGVLAPLVDRWFVAPLDLPRAAPLQRLTGALVLQGGRFDAWPGVGEATREALMEARPGDTVVIFGSFHTVAHALEASL